MTALGEQSKKLSFTTKMNNAWLRKTTIQISKKSFQLVMRATQVQFWRPKR